MCSATDQSTHRSTQDDAPRFNLRELSGSLGDLGTFLPIAVAMSLVCGMDIAMVFIFAGLMNIVTGLVFKQPLPVQPMKAIAAVAIAGQLSPSIMGWTLGPEAGMTTGAIASAGIITGAAVLLLACVGGIDTAARRIPKPVIRGIQAGVGIKLALMGIAWLGALPVVGPDSWSVALIAVALIIGLARWRLPVLLFIFVAGFGLLAWENPAAYKALVVDWPTFTLIQPTGRDWITGLTEGAIAQLPLTLLNSVIAVCALSADYFPGRGIVPKRMAISVGLMNIVCVPFGGMPMCHGAGGLAAQHRFGARTGGSVIMLGAFKITAGLLLGSVLLGTLQHYPVSVLAIMIVFAGVTLASAARDALQGKSLPILLVTAILIITINTLTGFLAGCLLALIVARIHSTHRNALP